MPAAAGEVIQYTFVQTIAGQQMETVLHFREIALGTTDGQRVALADEWLALQANVQHSSVIYSQVVIKQVTPLAFDEQLYTPIVTASGARGSSPINTMLAAILTKRTGVAGKTHRGRIYIGGITEDMRGAGENLLNTTGALAMGTFAAAAIGLLGPSGTEPNFRLGVYSRVLGGLSPFTVAGWQQVTSLDVQAVLGTQRRRRIGVGV